MGKACALLEVQSKPGPELAKDLATGTWRTQHYECRSKAMGNPNWFTVVEFVAKVDALGPRRAGG
ncbi:hypothetical protein KEG38_20595 [Polyangium jinanense]|uniref:hypothetical protein n=1 Tax=Polyangium jinanense TaxID=2829994 RepID=UPI00234174EE|nr:hypothetical protein [Polyangium jinanense]MDC3956272.1 hypothetical protein [Polyangium jinanense]